MTPIDKFSKDDLLKGLFGGFNLSSKFGEADEEAAAAAPPEAAPVAAPAPEATAPVAPVAPPAAASVAPPAQPPYGYMPYVPMPVMPGPYAIDTNPGFAPTEETFLGKDKPGTKTSYIEELVNKKIAEIKAGENIYEVGRVVKVQDYIVEASGLEDVGFFEKVILAGESEGYVNAIKQNTVLISVVNQAGPVFIGDEVQSTGEEFGAMFSEESLGHIVDMFGVDKMCDMKFARLEPLEIERPIVPIMDRTPVNRPLNTGVAGIDLIYPIGRGQRQLIIGDKKTGKTQIALDTIVNQKGKDMICIYIAIGKTKKSIREIYGELSRRGAAAYTIMLCAFNDEPPTVLSLTPYAGLAMAEKYLEQGKDVLVVIDDLKRHADAYREISLMLGKVPGRDAYPPDIFYTHARLLEKGCQHSNGGSITILPIVETKGGDITDYISTNIISITDGQIVLSKKNFDKGQKPAIDYGLSVSRLGGAVQTKPVKKLGAVVRRDLLSYLETREIYELANVEEMSLEMQSKINRGKNLVTSLNQYKYSPRDEDNIIDTFREIMDMI